MVANFVIFYRCFRIALRRPCCVAPLFVMYNLKGNLESDDLASFRKIGALRERERGAKSIAGITADN